MGMQSELPGAYKRVNYLERTNQLIGPYIIINYRASAGDLIHITVQKNATATNEMGFAGSNGSMELYYLTNGTIAAWRSNYLSITNVVYGPPDKAVVEMIMEGSVFQNLFTYNRSQNYKFSGRIYEFYISVQGGERKINLIPCVRKADNEPGMYDTVSKTFYSNAGDGEFIVPA